jgi:glycosyltransferase involved in cell wall biosynthesis
VGPDDPELLAAGAGFARTAIFAGCVNYRLDFDLLERAARANQGTLTAVFGPVLGLDGRDAATWSSLQRLENVRYFGPVDPDRLAALYRSADLGIIPYKHERSLVKNGFPLKALEMCATGLPVVSSLMEPIAGLARALVVARDDREFLEAFATTQRNAMTDSQRDELKALCDRNDYDLKFAEILRTLDSLGGEQQISTRLDHLIERLGRDSWAAACRATLFGVATDVAAALAARGYSTLGETLPASVRYSIPASVRERVRRRIAH